MELQICCGCTKFKGNFLKILVTGATGFIGNHVINELLKNEENEVIATSKDIHKAKEYTWFSKVNYIEYDINSNQEINLYEYFKTPNKVIHLAWEGLSNYNDLNHIEKNLFNHYKFIKNLVANGLKEITITGTCFEYGMTNGCLDESMPTKPHNAYAIAKDSLRRFIEELSKNFDFNYQWIRLFYMYGEGQSKKALLSLLEQSIKNGDKEFNMSGGEQLRDYLNIKNVVKNILLISNQTLFSNQIINCCNGKPISIRKLVENHLNKKEYNIKLNLGFYSYPNHEPMAFWGDNTKLNLIKKGRK